jgi:CTP:molybdopterin cytidylyltransferase MocA
MNIREKIAALILSGGFSSRMPDFKPLLPVGETSALRRAIELFQKCGLSEILVVTGHRAADLGCELSQTRARAVFNPRYAEGMFSSVTAGVGALDADCKAFFILPVDVPLVRPSTIQALLAA